LPQISNFRTTSAWGLGLAGGIGQNLAHLEYPLACVPYNP
jgi:hypothetical protein